MIRLCRYNETDYDETEWEPIDFFPWRPISYIKTRLFTRLDKDTKHATVCKIIGRHKSPHESKEDEPISLHDMSWNCIRCGHKCEINLMIPDSIIEGTEPWSDWKEYARLAQI